MVDQENAKKRSRKKSEKSESVFFGSGKKKLSRRQKGCKKMKMFLYGFFSKAKSMNMFDDSWLYFAERYSQYFSSLGVLLYVWYSTNAKKGTEETRSKG